MWKVNEENDRDIEENTNADGDAIGFPKVNQLASAKEWGHATHNILQLACRSSHVEPVAPENDDGEFDPEAALKKLQEADPYERRLKPITDDKAIDKGTPAWVVRMMGD